MTISTICLIVFCAWFVFGCYAAYIDAILFDLNMENEKVKCKQAIKNMVWKLILGPGWFLTTCLIEFVNLIK